MVDLPAGQRGGVERAIGGKADDLDAEVPGFEESEGLAVFADAENRGGGGGAEVAFAAFAGGYGPDEGGGRGEDFGEAGAFAQMAVAGYGYPLGRAFFELVDAGLGPEVGTLSGGGLRREKGDQGRGEGEEPGR